MKWLPLVVLFFYSFHTSSQNNSSVIYNAEALKMGMYSMNTAYVGSMWVAIPSEDISGSKFLFQKWSNKALFHTKDNKVFSLQSVNIDLYSNVFVARFGRNLDSIFSFNSNTIDKVSFDNSTFKIVSINNQNKIAQELFEYKNYGIYKFSFLKIVEGSVNPMRSRKTDSYVQKSKLYFKNNGVLTEFKLKKKNILQVVPSSNTERDILIHFYKQNNLSYKKIESLKKYLLTL